MQCDEGRQQKVLRRYERPARRDENKSGGLRGRLSPKEQLLLQFQLRLLLLLEVNKRDELHRSKICSRRNRHKQHRFM